MSRFRPTASQAFTISWAKWQMMPRVGMLKIPITATRPMKGPGFTECMGHLQHRDSKQTESRSRAQAPLGHVQWQALLAYDGNRASRSAVPSRAWDRELNSREQTCSRRIVYRRWLAGHRDQVWSRLRGSD